MLTEICQWNSYIQILCCREVESVKLMNCKLLRIIQLNVHILCFVNRMPKPLSSNAVMWVIAIYTCYIIRALYISDKEIDLPFPAEHPYYSHIKCFSMIPNTSPTVEATKLSNKDMSYPVFIKEKASDGWSRIEDIHINSRICHSTGPIWDYPRSHRHQVLNIQV